MYRKIIRSWLIFVVLFLVVSALVYGYFAYGFLSANHPVSAEILVVEGWLPEDALDQARDEFIRNNYRLLITTGFPYTKGINLARDGMFAFDLGNRIVRSPDNTYEVSVKLRGTPAKGSYAHFSLLADSLPVGQQFSRRKVQDYRYTVQRTAPPGWIQIVFDNDAISKNHDRNLYIYSVTVNKQTFIAGDSTVLYYVSNDNGYKFRQRLAAGSADDAANYLRSKGISDDNVIAIETTGKKRSKTYTTALDVRQWLTKNSTDSLYLVNVFSQGPHAKRTWISYCKAFNGSAHVGIIACENEEIRAGNWWKTKKGWRLILYETMGVVLAKLIL